MLKTELRPNVMIARHETWNEGMSEYLVKMQTTVHAVWCIRTYYIPLPFQMTSGYLRTTTDAVLLNWFHAKNQIGYIKTRNC